MNSYVNVCGVKISTAATAQDGASKLPTNGEHSPTQSLQNQSDGGNNVGAGRATSAASPSAPIHVPIVPEKEDGRKQLSELVVSPLTSPNSLHNLYPHKPSMSVSSSMHNSETVKLKPKATESHAADKRITSLQQGISA